MTVIGDFSEREFVHRVLGTVARTARRESFDDCVIVDLQELTGVRDLPYLVYSVDHPSFVRHASPDLPPFRFYGRWLAAVTCNDVVAMGARCKGFSLDLAAPLTTEVADVRELLTGIREVLDSYGADYEGGNYDANELETVGFAWGVVDRHAIVRRQGARQGDSIAVTGTLGQGWVEYIVRKRGLYEKLDADSAKILRHYKEMPVAAHAPIAAAAERGCFSSGMDLSDGVVDFLHTISQRGECGVVIDAECLPVSRATLTSLPLVAEVTGAPLLLDCPGAIALEPGYDSPLVHGFTVPAGSWDAARRVFEDAGRPLHRIGEVVEAPGVRLLHAGREVEIPPFWDDQCRAGDTVEAWVEFLGALDAPSAEGRR